jgi:hypothetical protein
MAETYDEANNITTFELTTPESFSCYQMFSQSDDPRNLDRSEESRELKNLIINNQKHAQIVVKYGESYSYLKNR